MDALISRAQEAQERCFSQHDDWPDLMGTPCLLRGEAVVAAFSG
jgi:hypothetical protein